MDATDAGRYCARMSALPQMLERVRVVSRESGLERAILLRVELVVEELFSNTLRHGYGGDCDAPVWLHALCTPGLLCITYQDAASPFDLLAYRADLAQPLEGRTVGGVGICLICELANSVAYRRAEDRNIVTVTFAQTARGS
jgi:anti-sigma regulatory factor (Ser/Thr protein kinase)